MKLVTKSVVQKTIINSGTRGVCNLKNCSFLGIVEQRGFLLHFTLPPFHSNGASFDGQAEGQSVCCKSHHKVMKGEPNCCY
jgi:hypothetical protein